MICCLLWILPPERSIWNGQRPCLHSQILVRPGNPEFARVYIWRSLEAPDWLLSKRLVSWLGFTNLSKPEPLNNLGEKDEDLELSEPLADAHAGALAEREAHKRMNWLLGEMIHELLSKAHDTYIFFLGFHPSFWQEHFRVVDKLKRRWKHVKLSMSISKFAHLRCRLLQTPGLKKYFPPQGCAAWSYSRELFKHLTIM